MTRGAKRITDARGNAASRLGMAGNPRQESGCVQLAYDAGVNYFFFYGPGHITMVLELAELIPRHRDSLIIATGSGSRSTRGLSTAWRKIVGPLGTGRVDVFFAEYISPADDLANIVGAGGVLDVLQDWKDKGRIRFAGVTTHDRQLARRLISDPRVDVLMHRFNMAHRKAAREVFPAAVREGKPVVAFTATRWGTLLERPQSWNLEVPRATDCYRYCLTEPAVQVVLTAPASITELQQNLQILSKPKMGARQRTKWEQFGDYVYGTGRDDFETLWA